MKKITLTQILMLALTLTGLTTIAQTQVFWVDLNWNTTTTPTTGNWNNMTNVATPLANIMNGDGTASTYTITITDLFNTANTTGSTTPGGSNPFPSTATSDAFVGTTTDTGAFTISGLNASKEYSFLIFGARSGVTENREALYTATGLNVGTATLNASSNNDNTCIIANIKPDASGNIVLGCAKGPNNVNSTGYFYINCFKITETTPVPAQVLLTAEAGSAVEGEFLHVDALKMHVMANGPGESVADFEVVANPLVAGINTSANVVKFTRRTSGDNAMPWGGFWTDVIDEALRPDVTVNKYVHVKILKQQASPQKFKLEAGTTPNFELNSINSYTTVGQWQDMVFYFPDANSIYQRVGLMPDFEDPLVAGADRIIYFDDITINNSPTPITAATESYLAGRVSLYPNPANNSLFIDSLEDLNSVSIFSIDGRQVATFNKVVEGTNNLNIENLSKGIYMVHFTAKNGATLTQKLIKE